MAPGIWTTHQGMLTFLEELKNATKRGSGEMFFVCVTKALANPKF